MTDHNTPRLSPRHERFVAAYLKDGDATQACIRAGYSRRDAHLRAARLLRDPRIEAAITAGRRRIAEALAVTAERVTQEYARIAFANVADFVSTDSDGRPRLDLGKAHPSQLAGILELRIDNHSKLEQRVTLTLGKLQALAALARLLGVPAVRPKPAETLDGLADDLREGKVLH